MDGQFRILKREQIRDDENKRLFAVLIDSKGDHFFEGDKRKNNLIEGNEATFMQALQQFVNQTAVFEMALEYYRGSDIKKLQAKMILFVLGYLTSEIKKFIEIQKREKSEEKTKLKDAWTNAA